MTDLEFYARMAANIFYNITQFDRPLTDHEKKSCKEVQEGIDQALNKTRNKYK